MLYVLHCHCSLGLLHFYNASALLASQNVSAGTLQYDSVKHIFIYTQFSSKKANTTRLEIIKSLLYVQDI